MIKEKKEKNNVKQQKVWRVNGFWVPYYKLIHCNKRIIVIISEIILFLK